jgi:hypothetical protein
VIWWTLALAAEPGDVAVELAARLVDEVGPRSALTEAGARAQTWVHEELERAGWPARTRTYGDYPTTWSCRSGDSPRIILFVAHTDTRDERTLGAHDNASGVAALLVAARHIPVTPRRTVCFAFPDANGLGQIGSRGFAAAVARGALGGPVDQVVAVDGVGGGEIVHAGLGAAFDAASLRETLRVAAAPAPWLLRAIAVYAPATHASDDRWFAEAGLRASRLTARREPPPPDTPAQLDPRSMGRAVRLVRHLARAKVLPEPSSKLDPALPTPWGVIPGLGVRLLSAMGAVVGLATSRGADRTTLRAVAAALCAGCNFGLMTWITTAAPSPATTTLPLALASGWFAWAATLWLWPWPPSATGGRALALWPALCAAAIGVGIGPLLAWPLALSALAVAMGAGRRGGPLWVIAAAAPAWLALYPEGALDLAAWGALPATPGAWAVAHTALAGAAAGVLDRRGVPRGPTRWLPGATLASLAMAVAGFAWLRAA